MNLRAAWLRKSEALGLERDPAQLDVLAMLETLGGELERRHERASGLTGLLRRGRGNDAPRGLYLWGGVGRGKTLLMNTFCESLAVESKRRVHFHRFMGEVHDRLAAMRDVRDPLERVAADLAGEAAVLCFDEFFVSDIADAMILGGLLERLFRHGVVLVTTSNTAPRDLYRDGLQRSRFLPAIALLEEHTRVVQMAGDVDYRLRLLRTAGTFLHPADAAADATLGRYFRDMAAGAEQDTSFTLAGRPVAARQRAKGIVWFEFRELCEGPRSTRDYIEIARRHQTVIVSGVPVLGPEQEDAARRFVDMVDEFYDRRVKLIVSAAAPPDALYAGKRLGFEFRRTISRLLEMQSPDYLHAAHLS
ncbi:MAG TPA: cell division protein ZapE [Woeseiaceae bacterium]